MKKLHSLSLAALLATATLPAFAQQEAAPATKPAMAASMPMDCAMGPAKRHDHGAERGLGTTAPAKTMGAACAHEGAASATGGKAKKKPLHDHAKFHKNQ